MSVTCPCCGSAVPLDALPVDVSLTALGLAPIERRVVALLLEHLGQWVSLERQVFAAWGDRQDGGPEDASGNLRTHLSRARIALKAVGLRIETEWGGGVAGSYRRLVRA